MIKSLQQASLLDILPSNLIADKKIYAAAESLNLELKKVIGKTKLVLHLPRLDELPDEVLDSLAYQYHCDFWEEGLSREAKCNLIRNSIAWHRIKGTPAAVEQLLSNIFNEVKLEEWFNYAEGEGKPYRFRVRLGGFKQEVDEEYILRMINAGKNLRSHLDWIEIDLTEKEYDDEKEEWVYPERNVLMHYLTFANSFSNWRNVPFQSIDGDECNILLSVLTGQGGAIDVAADYTIKDGILLPNAAITSTHSAIREVPSELLPLPLWIVDILAPSYSAIRVATKTSSHKTLTINLAPPDGGMINLHQGHALIGSKVKTLNIETPKGEALHYFTSLIESLNARREIDTIFENPPPEITGITKSSYNRLYAASRNNIRALRYLHLPTPNDALAGLYAAIQTFQNARREIPSSTENIPEWLVDIKNNQAGISIGTKLKRQASKILELDSLDDEQTEITTAIVAEGGRVRSIELETPKDGNSELFVTTQQVKNNAATIKADSTQLQKLLYDFEGDAFGDMSTNLQLAIREKKSRCVTVNTDHNVENSTFKANFTSLSSRNRFTRITADGEQLRELFESEGLDKATILPTVTLTEKSARCLTIKPDYNTGNHLQATTTFWNSRSRRVEIESAQQDTLPKEITDIKAPAKLALNVNSRLKQQNTKILNIETPADEFTTSTVFFIANQRRRRRINFGGVEEVKGNAKITLWNQRSRYVEIGLDLEQLEQLISKRKSKILPHVGLTHVGSMAVQ